MIHEPDPITPQTNKKWKKRKMEKKIKKKKNLLRLDIKMEKK